MSGLQSYPTLTSDDPADLMAAINQIARIRQQDIGLANNSNTNISNIGTTGCIACSATGTNAIALTQNANQQAISAYNNYQQFSFVAVHNSTGNVTVNINAIGTLNLYKSDGATQAATGDITIAVLYTISYNSALNSNAGGFQITSGSASKNLSVTRQTFTGNGTYTPPPGMVYCDIELWGGGGGGGGASAVNGAGAAGGAAGGYARKIVTAATIGSSQTVTIGSSGTAGANTGGTGGTGGATSVGAIVSATGGVGGTGNTSATTSVQGATGGAGSSGDINGTGQGGFNSISLGSTTGNSSGAGGASSLGGAGRGLLTALGAAANAANNTGSGGGGAASSGSALVGGTGGTGYVVVTEYIYA